MANVLVDSPHSVCCSTKLAVIDRTVLIEARLLGKKMAPVMIATREGASVAVVDAVTRVGGHVLSRQDDIGYVLAQMPLDSVADFARREDLTALQVVTSPVRGFMRDEERGATAQIHKGPPPGPWLQADNPYTGEAATQAALFKSLHPRFDGRGVTIGLAETADPTLPSMHGALDGSGNPRPKFLDFDLGPSEHSGAPTDSAYDVLWQDMEVVRHSAAGTATIGGHVFQLPHGTSESQWRICLRLPKSDGWDHHTWAILWGVTSRKVWVMPDSAPSFDAAVVAPVAAPYFIVRLGARAASTPEYTSLTWLMKVDESSGKLGVMPSYARHAAMMTSVMAGERFLGSAAGGVAPAAQLSTFNHGWPDRTVAPTAANFESLLSMLRSPAVDVAVSSEAMGDGSRGASNVYAVLSHRLQQLTDKPFIKGQSNSGPERGRFTDLSADAQTLSLGGYVPQATWKANFGFEPSAAETPAEYTTWGPGNDGGLKPDFLALTHTLDEAEYKRPGYYDPPYGLYGVSGGTSAAGPHAAGLIALLVSASKQAGVPHDVARLRAALASTARSIPGVEARVQGHGLIQVNDAWAALQRAGRWEPPQITIKAPVVSAERRGDRPLRGEGRGLYEQGGWSPGQSGQRTITFVRTTGPVEPIAYDLRWHESIGGHGGRAAYSSALTRITLPLNRPVSLPLDIRIAEAGSYSAILDLIDPTVDLVAQSVMSTIVVGEPLSPERGLTATLSGLLQRPGNAVAWVEVPSGLSTLTVHVQRADRERVQLKAQDGAGRLMPNLIVSAVQQETGASLDGESVTTFQAPTPGLWQFWLSESSRILEPSSERLRAVPWRMEFQGARIGEGPASVSLPSDALQVSFTNHGAPLSDARIQGTLLGSAYGETVSFKSPDETRTFDVQVPDGTERLEFECQADVAEGGRFGLYVYKKPDSPDEIFDDRTALVYYDGSYEPHKRYVLSHPPAGHYVIAVDALSVPSGGLRVRNRDAYFHPLFGEVNVHDDGNRMARNETRSAIARVAIRAWPADGRVLVGSAALFSAGVGDSKRSEPAGRSSAHSGVGPGSIVPVPLAERVWEVLSNNGPR